MDFSALAKMLCFSLFLWLLMFLYLSPEGRSGSSCLMQLPQHTVALTEDAFCGTSVRFSSDQQGSDHYFLVLNSCLDRVTMLIKPSTFDQKRFRFFFLELPHAFLMFKYQMHCGSWTETCLFRVL